jgi:hypothetical protein
MPITEPTSLKAAGCCPTLSPCGSCDELDFVYRMPFPTVVALPAGGQQTVPVEVTMRFRLERCSGPLTLGDILYSTTLQPGEQVRLASSDRHTRFSFDSDTQLSSRQYTTSEESFYLAGMAQAASSLSVVSGGAQSSTFHDSSTSGGGSAGLDLGIFSIGGSLSGSSYDARSASTAAARRVSRRSPRTGDPGGTGSQNGAADRRPGIRPAVSTAEDLGRVIVGGLAGHRAGQRITAPPHAASPSSSRWVVTWRPGTAADRWGRPPVPRSLRASRARLDTSARNVL